MNAIDTSVLAYAIDAQGGSKTAGCAALLARLEPSDTVLPWQVLVELGGGAKFDRQGRTLGDVVAYVESLVQSYQVVYPDPSVVAKAIGLVRGRQLQYWDALIIASCAHAGVKTLYSEDLPGRMDGALEGVRVVNPLV